MFKSFAFGVLVASSSFGYSFAHADTMQIQIHGDMPDKLTAQLNWLDSLSLSCQDNPCNVKSKNIRISRHSSGIGVINVDIPTGATRVCLQELRQRKMVSAILYLNNGKSIKLRKGSTIAGDGTSGCTGKQTAISDAQMWRVDVE